MSVLVLNCPEIPGGGDCEHMGEVYVCLWGLDVCKGVLEYSGLVWCKKCSILEMLERQNLTLLKHQSIIVLLIVIPCSISNRRASFMDSYSRSTRLLFRSKAGSHSIGPIPAFKCLDPLVDNLMKELPNQKVFFKIEIRSLSPSQLTVV